MTQPRESAVWLEDRECAATGRKERGGDWKLRRPTSNFCGGFAVAKEKFAMVDLGQVHYYVMCIGEFARMKGINAKDAFNYLHAYKGVEFLIECYDVEHTLSLENAVEDLTHVCRNNGGNIA